MAATNPFDISGKAAIVTGGAMGIGFGIVRRFVESGANVLLTDLDEQAAKAALARLPRGPGRAEAMQADVSLEGADEAMVARCVERFGGVDVLVNNAGIYPAVPVLQMSPELLDQVYQVNIRGLVFASKAAGARMIQQGRGGSIINLSSIAAFHPSSVGLAAYGTSKAGVSQFTKSLALELAPHRIRVNAIAPGGVITEGANRQLQSMMTPEQEAVWRVEYVKAKIPLGRFGDPDDIARVAVFLASSASEYVTGSDVLVDGGMLLT
ncbi:SDR family NAD(P)-dependent oxidoreductase [Vitiosangium sp. GDMCC 1.1324]|uniref:SDR family NAD(P)-dependent oxidoreductase n=1 Tax=Vitiosangium sp. (strain GDMCC 1.1324) TaxID=2138576 RepID=UPI000D35F741|nr:SDR family oxidoreductase [Vitiosangium sp. GDMCC 1.1324]PTL83672.1 SDR family oxidoreductase [Vitiosangium sp. GDMCC 1.1324]